ncbi:MAG: T9SS type A sorting domain-containing protein [Bacteroidota bacterium]|nr:T9SS type A sorting domain-containing protein [Bacteroidota bacterium]
MKYMLHFTIGIVLILLTNIASNAQSPHMGYAVTDSQRLGFKWNFLRTIDLRSGEFGNAIIRLLNGSDTLPVNNLPNGIAAIAHDRKNKRVYFTPMLIDRLSYVDLRTLSIHTVSNNFTGLMPKNPNQSNVITRMVIGDDDNGYALTNDGKALYRFSVGNNPAITSLGPLQDAVGNLVSVHESCSSYGGDIIADNDGHLYLLTIRNHLFRIKLQTRVANYLGTVSGLPVNFTSNGVAVNQQGNKLILVSSVDATGVYSVSIQSLEAERLTAGNTWHTADLGGSNLLKSKKDDQHKFPEMIVSSENEQQTNIQLFPNPVTSNLFQVQFLNIQSASFTIKVFDTRGEVIVSRQVNAGKNNIVSITLPAITAKGIYMVQINDKSGQVYFRKKIVVQ